MKFEQELPEGFFGLFVKSAVAFLFIGPIFALSWHFVPNSFPWVVAFVMISPLYNAFRLIQKIERKLDMVRFK